jgi:hypothetical protein
MDSDQTVRMHRLVWIHAGRKRTMLVLSWRVSFVTTTVKAVETATKHSVHILRLWGSKTKLICDQALTKSKISNEINLNVIFKNCESEQNEQNMNLLYHLFN